MKNSKYLDDSKNIKFDFDKKSQIFWIGLIQTPSTQQIDTLVEIINKLENKFILHIQHIGEDPLSPTFHLILHILSHLNNNKNIIKNRLIATIIQPKRECPVFKVVKNIGLALYKPTKPLSMSSEKEDIEKFIANLK